MAADDFCLSGNLSFKDIVQEGYALQGLWRRRLLPSPLCRRPRRSWASWAHSTARYRLPAGLYNIAV